MKKVILKSILACLILASGGCVNPDSAGTSSGSSTAPPPTVVPDPPVATAASPLQLQIQTIYDTTENVQTHTFVETGTTTCEATDATPVVTCTVQIPEARLFFSKVRFNYSWRNDKCKLMTFQPYFYLASKTAGYQPKWFDAAVDCTNQTASCFGGAAPQLVDKFPKNLAIIYISDPTNSTPQNAKKDLVSGWSLSRYKTNRTAANDIDPSKIGSNQFFISENDTYVAGTYIDYQFSCQDDWYEDQTYHIKLIIQDVDSTHDDFTTWKEL